MTRKFVAMHYSDVVSIRRAEINSHIVVDEKHYIVIGYANDNKNHLILRRKFGRKVFLAIRETFYITRMTEV